MANETKVDEFLGDLSSGKETDPFDNKAADILPTTEKEEIQGNEEKEESKPLPFHKDPKVQRYLEREIAKKMAEFEPVSKDEPEPTATDIDEVLTRIIGNDTPEKISAIKDFKRVLIEREDKGAEKAFERIQAEQNREAEEESEADDELVTGFENIEEDFGVDITSDDPQSRKLRGDFINFIRKVAPKNEDGEVVEFPDLVQTFEVFQSTRPKPQASRAKDLADRSNERGSSAPADVTPEDKSWGAVDKIIERLTGR